MLINRSYSPKPFQRRYSFHFKRHHSALVDAPHKQLLRDSDQEKVNKIAEVLLPSDLRNAFFQKFSGKPLSILLSNLISYVEMNHEIPVKCISSLQNDQISSYFENNSDFNNLPYSRKVEAWSDRTAMTEVLRNRFPSLFTKNDLVTIPGCADGQIPIEILAQAMKNDMKLNIVGTDLNPIALKIGYCITKAYNLNPNGIQWLQADAVSPFFFDWLSTEYPSHRSHRVVTLLQPCLPMDSLESLLRHHINFAKQTQSTITVALSVLLEDPESYWYQLQLKMVKQGTLYSKETKWGTEFLKINNGHPVPWQSFMDKNAMDLIQKELGYQILFQPEDVENKQATRKIYFLKYS